MHLFTGIWNTCLEMQLVTGKFSSTFCLWPHVLLIHFHCSKSWTCEKLQRRQRLRLQLQTSLGGCSRFKLKTLCSTRIPFLVDTHRVDPWGIGTVIVHTGLNHVMKKFSLPRSVFADFKELYSYLFQDMLPHAVTAKKVVADGVQLCNEGESKKLKKILDGSGILEIELHIEPVGCPLDPETLSSANVVQMTWEVLLCLEALHQRGFCHYDVRPTNTILYRQGFYLIDFELAGKTNSRVRLDSPWWNQSFKDSYDVKNELYMLGKHVIEQCGNSPTDLQQLGKVLVEYKCATAKDA